MVTRYSITGGPSPPDDTEDMQTGQILCVRVVKQTSKPIQFDIQTLRENPPRSGPWVRCLVPAKDSDWAQISGAHWVGKTPDDEFHEVAVYQPYIPWLRDHGLSFELEPAGVQHDVLKPTEGEVGEYGVLGARRRAESRLIQRAVAGIWAEGRGLVRYYRSRIAFEPVMVAIEWAVMIRDIVESPPEVLEEFLLMCVFLGVQLRDFDEADELGLLERDRDAWIQYFCDLGFEKTLGPAEDARLERHEISLIRALLVSAGGQADALHHNFDDRQSVCDNFASLGHIFDISPQKELLLGSVDEQEVKKTLLRSKICGSREPDVGKLKKSILDHVPIGFLDSMDKKFPIWLKHNLGYGEIRAAYWQSVVLSKHVPSIQDEAMLLLLCNCAGRPVDPVLCQWVNSKEGADFYQRTITGICAVQSPDQTILTLSALVWFMRLLPFTPDDVSDPVNGSYLWDYGHLLRGQNLKSRRAVWERMALSISRVASKEECYPTIRNLLDVATNTQPLLHVLDGMSDNYWSCRLRGRLSHSDAREETRRRFEESHSNPSWV